MVSAPTLNGTLPSLMFPGSACVLSAAPAGVKLTPSASSVAIFDIVKLALRVEKPDAPNPFTNVVVSAEVTPPSGPAVRVDGYCDAADGSMFRALCPPPGAG